MYKLLLCCRYLRTRYLALVCIVSVMLGVATLIVVNSVMAGFSTKLKERLHGHAVRHRHRGRRTSTASPTGRARCSGSASRRVGQHVEAMTPTWKCSPCSSSDRRRIARRS